MLNLNDIVSFVEKRFDIAGACIESQVASNILLIRVRGLDSVSLSKYILENFDDLKVTTNKQSINNFGWIKIEKNYKNELVLIK